MAIAENPNSPHRCVVFIQGEVHELLKTGECAGRPVHKIESFPIYFDGNDKFLAIQKANEFLAVVKQWQDK